MADICKKSLRFNVWSPSIGLVNDGGKIDIVLLATKTAYHIIFC
jgi:hypothetical protein